MKPARGIERSELMMTRWVQVPGGWIRRQVPRPRIRETRPVRDKEASKHAK